MSKLINKEKQKKMEKERMLQNVTDISELDEADRQKVVIIPDENLVDDPDNQEIYGDYEAEKLAESVRRYGFQGVLIAYPILDKNGQPTGKYQIESGHRRRVGGKAAGMTEFPVYLTEPPKSDSERIIRLNMANSLGRDFTPMTMNRMCQKQYWAHEQQLKEEGLTPTAKEIIHLVCEDFDISSGLYYKYKALSGLNPKLQSLVDREIFSWAAISEAASLSPERQEYLYQWLMKNIRLDFDNNEKIAGVTAIKIQEMIKSMRNPNWKPNHSESRKKENNVRWLRKEGKKIKNLILSDELDEDQLAALSILEDLKSDIESQINSLRISLHLIKTEDQQEEQNSAE